MSLAEVCNAILGVLAASGIKSAFTPEDSKAASKGDLKDLTFSIIRRYHLIKNIQRRDYDGALAYYDMETKEVVYSIWPL